MADLIERLRAATMGFDWSDLPDDALIPAVPLLREAATALSQEREAREKAEADRDHVTRTSDAYNATEREARAIMDEAAAIERAETLEASLAEAKRLLKPFAHEAREDDGQDRSDWTHAPDNEPLASFCDLTYGDFRAARDFLSQEPNHER